MNARLIRAVLLCIFSVLLLVAEHVLGIVHDIAPAIMGFVIGMAIYEGGHLAWQYRKRARLKAVPPLTMLQAARRDAIAEVKAEADRLKARQAACRHDEVVPVESGGQLVARLCTQCSLQLDAGFRTRAEEADARRTERKAAELQNLSARQEMTLREKNAGVVRRENYNTQRRKQARPPDHPVSPFPFARPAGQDTGITNVFHYPGGDPPAGGGGGGGGGFRSNTIPGPVQDEAHCLETYDMDAVLRVRACTLCRQPIWLLRPPGHSPSLFQYERGEHAPSCPFAGVY